MLIAMPCLAQAAPGRTRAPARPIFWANRYGARGDAATLDTAAIQKALDAARRRHGLVAFQPGIYLTGALFVKSGTELRVGRGVTLRGMDTLAGYPLLPTRVAGIEMRWPAALINVVGQHDVAIGGAGTIDGDGPPWWRRYWRLRRKYQPEGLRWAADYDCRRPRLIQIYNSRRVTLTGLRLIRSGFWTVHICYSRHVRVDGLTIRNNIGGRGPSTDGVDVDSSSYVLVERCDISNNDDALCLKAGRDADGLRVNRPATHVVIRDCIVRDSAAGFTIGSETSGGFRDIEVYGLTVLSRVRAGIKFKSAHTRGGGADGVRIHDIVLRGVPVPFDFNMNWDPNYSYARLPAMLHSIPAYYRIITRPVPAAEGLPHFRRVRIWNVRATGAQRAFAAAAFPQAPMVNFRFRNLQIFARAAGSIRDARDWTFLHARIHTQDGSRVRLVDCRHVRGLPPARAAH